MSICYRKGGGCGPYEMLSCGECPASKPSYAEKEKQGMTVYPSRSDHKNRHDSNYDRIISKSPEELAEWIETIADCALCQLKGKSCKGGRFESRASCKQCWLKWLREEATDGV